MVANYFLQLSDNNDNNVEKFILPFDIKVEIVSYLSQRECLECMLVCRTWKQQVPYYSQPVWSRLRLRPNNITAAILQEIHKDEQPQRLLLWEKCIGSHVEHVIFDGFYDDNEEKLYVAMNRLINNNCDRIKSIEFINCDSRDEILLLKLLQKLTSSTKKLKFTRHSADLYFIHLIHACPNLTHFSYSRSYYGSFRQRRRISTKPYITRPQSPFLHPAYAYHELVPSSSHQQRPLFPHLLQFNVESRCSDATLVSQIKHVLQHSPNLQYLSYELRGDGIFTFCNDLVSLDLHQVLASCPKLQYLRSNVPDDDFVFVKHTTGTAAAAAAAVDMTTTPSQLPLSVLRNDENIQKQGDNNNGLHYFMACETKNFGPDKMEPHLIRNACSLELLLFKGTMPFTEPTSSHQHITTMVAASLVNWTRLLQSIHAPRLRKLVFYNIFLDTRDPDIIPNMTSQCPALQELILEVYSPNNRRTIAVDIVRLANNTKQLRKLIFAGITVIAVIPATDNSNANNNDSNNNNKSDQLSHYIESSLDSDSDVDEQQKTQYEEGSYSNRVKPHINTIALFRDTWAELQEININNIHLICNDNELFYMALKHLPRLKYLQVPKKLRLIHN